MELAIIHIIRLWEHLSLRIYERLVPISLMVGDAFKWKSTSKLRIWFFVVSGIDTIRRSKFLNNELPSPRHISNEIYAEQQRRAARNTFLNLMQLKQEKNLCNGKPNYSKPIAVPWKHQPHEYTFSFLGYMFGQLVAVHTANRIITKGPGNLLSISTYDCS